MARGIFAVALEDDVVLDTIVPDVVVPDTSAPSDGAATNADTAIDVSISDDEVTVDIGDSADSVGVELEPIESDAVGIDSQISELEFGIECLVTLESIIDSVSLESIQDPAIVNSVNISMESLCRKLGLEASELVYHSEGSSSDGIKNHADKVKNKLTEVWEKIVRFIKMLWAKLQEFLHRYTSIIAANLSNWTAGVDKKIKDLPDKGNCYDRTVEINNMSLARAYNLYDTSTVLTIEKAAHMSKQLSYIYLALTACFNNLKSGDVKKIVENNTIGAFIKPIKDEILVNGIKVEGTDNGINVEYGKIPRTSEIRLHTPKSKGEMLDLNSELKNHIYEVNTLFIRIHKDTEFQSKIISGIKITEIIGKVTKDDTSQLRLIRAILEAALKFMKLMQGIATDTYRAVLKFLILSCGEMKNLHLIVN